MTERPNQRLIQTPPRSSQASPRCGLLSRRVFQPRTAKVNARGACERPIPDRPRAAGRTGPVGARDDYRRWRNADVATQSSSSLLLITRVPAFAREAERDRPVLSSYGPTEALDRRRHRTDEFTSAQPSLDLWLRADAAQRQRRGASRTFVVESRDQWREDDRSRRAWLKRQIGSGFGAPGGAPRLPRGGCVRGF